MAAITLPMLVTGCNGTPKPQPANGDARRDVDLAADVAHLADRLVYEEAFTGVVSLTRNGQPLFRQAFGMADRAAQRPNTLETPFALASVGKMFTAVVVAQLAERNQIAFDAPWRLPTRLPRRTGSFTSHGATSFNNVIGHSGCFQIAGILRRAPASQEADGLLALLC